jgi:hypothetical protein
MIRRSLVLAVLAASVATAAVAEPARPVPPGGDPAMACGQTPDGRAYWAEYGYCDQPVRGPAGALGLILWSHGVSGQRDQYKGSPPPFVRRLSQAGWDVVKVNRNPLYEHGWTASGGKHVDDLVQRARQANGQGYARVIAAGQSFGGVISIEANARAPNVFYGVVAASPGHGSDSPSFTPGASGSGYFNLDRYLLDALAGQHSGRLVVSLPPGDLLHPNRDSDPIGPKARKILASSGLPFVQFDESLPITGHGAASTNQFDTWFGGCLQTFLDPRRPAASGETKCASPDPVPAFLLPAGFKSPMAGQAGAARWLGVWDGRWPGYAAEFRLIVDKVQGTTAAMYYCVGAGPKRDLSMACYRYTNGRLEGGKIVVDRGNARTLELVLSADGRKVDATHKAAASTIATTLTPYGSSEK